MKNSKAKTKSIVFEGNGASISMISEITGMTRSTVRKRIKGLKQFGEKKGYPTYDTQEILRAVYKAELVSPQNEKGDQDRTPRNPMEWKAHYEAETKRLDFEMRTGELIEKETFYDELSTAFRTVVSNLENLPDILEAEVGLKPTQKDRVEASIRDLRTKMYEQIADYDGE